jgi:ankyrin repeat protein
LGNSPFWSNDSTLHTNADFEGSHPLSDPLETALGTNHLGMVQLLIDHGADVNDRPFVWACAEHEWSIEAVRLLLRAGANVNLAMANTGATPLLAAAYRGNITLVKELLKWKPNVNDCDNGGETPLGVAYRRGFRDIVYLLLRMSPHVWPALMKVW